LRCRRVSWFLGILVMVKVKVEKAVKVSA